MTIWLQPRISSENIVATGTFNQYLQIHRHASWPKPINESAYSIQATMRDHVVPDTLVRSFCLTNFGRLASQRPVLYGSQNAAWGPRTYFDEHLVVLVRHLQLSLEQSRRHQGAMSCIITLHGSSGIKYLNYGIIKGLIYQTTEWKRGNASRKR
jgi:hypothetical protein